MGRCKRVVLTVLALSCLPVLGDQDGLAANAPAKINIPTQADRVELPSAGEIIGVLKKMGSKVYVPEPKKTATTVPYKVAINLGIAVAGSFACIAERDRVRLEKYADMIYGYGKVLAVQQALLTRYNEFKQALTKNDWNRVTNLVGLLQAQALATLQKSYRKDEAAMALAAGWLEGSYILSKTLESRFNPKVAKELLGYRDLNQYLVEQYRQLNPKTREKPEVKAIFDGLRKIHMVMSRPANYVFTLADVKKIVAITTPLRAGLMK